MRPLVDSPKHELLFSFLKSIRMSNTRNVYKSAEKPTLAHRCIPPINVCSGILKQGGDGGTAEADHRSV